MATLLNRYQSEMDSRFPEESSRAMQNLRSHSDEIAQRVEQLDKFIAENQNSSEVLTTRQIQKIELAASDLLCDLHVAYIRWRANLAGFINLTSHARFGTYEELSLLAKERQDLEWETWQSVRDVRTQIDDWMSDITNKPGWVKSFWATP